eukprot:scaffold1483_cov159-Pinguiococcus_pyrenoidosus.AAC.3
MGLRRNSLRRSSVAASVEITRRGTRFQRRHWLCNDSEQLHLAEVCPAEAAGLGRSQVKSPRETTAVAADLCCPPLKDIQRYWTSTSDLELSQPSTALCMSAAAEDHSEDVAAVVDALSQTHFNEAQISFVAWFAQKLSYERNAAKNGFIAAKSINTAGGVASTALVFTPLFPIGLVLAAAVGVSSLIVAGSENLHASVTRKSADSRIHDLKENLDARQRCALAELFEDIYKSCGNEEEKKRFFNLLTLFRRGVEVYQEAPKKDKPGFFDQISNFMSDASKKTLSFRMMKSANDLEKSVAELGVAEEMSVLGSAAKTAGSAARTAAPLLARIAAPLGAAFAAADLGATVYYKETAASSAVLHEVNDMLEEAWSEMVHTYRWESLKELVTASLT